MKSPYYYFTEAEFQRCHPSCSCSDMDSEFMRLLSCARDEADTPFLLLSAYRSVSHDLARGRSGTGYHTKGRAVDISCSNSGLRHLIVKACLAHGLSVGVYPSFLHIDNRKEPILFLG